MKFEISREWIEAKARSEGDYEIGAGLLGFDPSVDDGTDGVVVAEESRLAFSRFVALSRRNLRLSAEGLADYADVELAEVMSIESDLSYEPEPRTVHQLAHAFSVDQRKLMELSGLARPKSPAFIHEAVRYAARSESLEELSEDEMVALEAMVAILSKR